jgi:hypothetical protein
MPVVTSRAVAGIVAGTLAGLAMTLAVMLYHWLQGKSVWTNPNLIAAMWMGEGVANGRLSPATPVGFATHMATSAVMGWIAVPFIHDLPPWRTVLAAFSYSLASVPAVGAAVISWANPLLIQRSELVPVTVAHTVFGIVLGAGYLWLRRDALPSHPVDSVA